MTSLIPREPVVVDGVRYNPVPDYGGCRGCSIASRYGSERFDFRDCTNIQAIAAVSCHPARVIWLTDTDFAVRRLTQRDPP